MEKKVGNNLGQGGGVGNERITGCNDIEYEEQKYKEYK